MPGAHSLAGTVVFACLRLDLFVNAMFCGCQGLLCISDLNFARRLERNARFAQNALTLRCVFNDSHQKVVVSLDVFVKSINFARHC